MTAPMATLPTCTLWVDGQRYADGGTPGEVDTDPVALTDLAITWGRDNTLDQPEPGTCTFHVLDIGGGARFTDRLHIGATLQVRADATIYPDPTVPIFTYDPGFEALAVGAVPPSTVTGGTIAASAGGPPHTGTRSARLDALPGSDAMAVTFPPAPYGGDSAWDAVPRALAGQTWHWGVSVLMTNMLLGNQTVRVMPVAFSAPRADAATPLYDVAVAIPVGTTGWQTVLEGFVPPEGVWLGLRVEVRPAGGPRWDDIPAGSDWTLTATNYALSPGATQSAGFSVHAPTATLAMAAGWAGFANAAQLARIATGSTRLGIRASWPAAGTYAVRLQLRASESIAVSFQFRPNLESSTGAITVHSATVPAGDSVVEFIGAAPAPPGTTQTGVAVTWSSGAIGQTLAVTGIQMETGPAVGAYFDGDTPDTQTHRYAWAGTPGNSLSTHEARATGDVAWDDVGGAPTRTNLATNPTPASSAGWLANVGAQHVHTYNATDKCIDVNRQAAAAANVAASWYNAGNLVPYNPVLPAGVEYQRSIDVWVDQAGTLNNTGLSGGFTSTPLPANTWTTVVQRVTGTGAALGVMQGRVDIPGVGTGVHVKLRRAMLVAVTDAQPVPYFDGSTPDTPELVYDWTGTANASTSTATDPRTRVTWDEVGALFIDDLVMLAPASGALQSATIFTGRITDMRASYDLQAGGTVVDVIAQTHLAELDNRYVGDAPWSMEPLGTRFGRIVDASGQPVQYQVDSSVSGTQVSWRDVDSRPAGDLLHQLAQSVGGALWSAANSIGNAFLWLEDINNRPAMFELVMDPDGTVRIHQKGDVTEDATTVVLDACDVDLEPIEWVQTTEDDATRVVVNWKEQTLDGQGNQAPTARDMTVTNDGAERLTGRRRVQVTTELAQLTDAQLLGDALMARLTTPGWRIKGLTWDLSGVVGVGADVLQRVLKILDGVARMGLGILLTNVPDWAPTPVGEDIWLFLEGGTFRNIDGYWVLDLLTSNGQAQGAATVRWDDLPLARNPTLTNPAHNPRAVAGGAGTWTGTRGFGTGASGTWSDVTGISPAVVGNVTTARRKTWTVAATNNGSSGFTVRQNATNWFPVTAGTTVTVSAYVRFSGSGTRLMNMTLQFFTGTTVGGEGSAVATPIGTNVTVNPNVWTRLIATYVVPAGANSMGVFPDVAAGGTLWAVGNTMDATAVQVDMAATASGYFDGSSADTVDTDYAWNGTANSSTSSASDVRGWQWDQFDPAITWNDLHGVAI